MLIKTHLIKSDDLPHPFPKILTETVIYLYKAPFIPELTADGYLLLYAVRCGRRGARRAAVAQYVKSKRYFVWLSFEECAADVRTAVCRYSLFKLRWMVVPMEAIRYDINCLTVTVF